MANSSFDHRSARGLVCLVCVAFLHTTTIGEAAGVHQVDLQSHRHPPLRLLTWNIWMMPPWTFQSPKNSLRAEAISRCLLKEDFDIICLEKVFDGGARRVLSRALCCKYPFQYGPANAAWSILPFKPVNSGVWVLSRFPLFYQHEIEFSRCSNVECFSRKGALFLAGRFHGRPFQVIATHLQGDEGPTPTAPNDHVRLTQIQQIEDKLLDPLTHPGIPTFICGDFCTPRRLKYPSCLQTPAYREMLKRLKAQNGWEDRITLDDNRCRNQLAIDNTRRIAEEDYILCRLSGASVSVRRERRIFREPGWDGNRLHRDLSYRYAVSASVHFLPTR